MNKYDAMMVLENHRIRSPKKLYAAAGALLAYDAVTYHHDVRRLVDRAEASKKLAAVARRLRNVEA